MIFKVYTSQLGVRSSQDARRQRKELHSQSRRCLLLWIGHQELHRAHVRKLPAQVDRVKTDETWRKAHEMPPRQRRSPLALAIAAAAPGWKAAAAAASAAAEGIK